MTWHCSTSKAYLIFDEENLHNPCGSGTFGIFSNLSLHILTLHAVISDGRL